MKHVFSSTISDGSDATLVRPSNWNDTHILGIASVSTGTALTSTSDYVRATGGSGGIALTLPAASARSGQPYTIKKIDSGAGAVTVTPAGADTIDGAANYILLVQWQYVALVSNGSTGWEVVGNN